MIGTIDRAGRVVVPQGIREQLGLVPGEVEITVQGTRVQIEQPGTRLRSVGGHLLLPAGDALTSEAIRELRLVDQR